MSLGPQILAALAAASNPSQEVRIAGEQQLYSLRSNGVPFFSACVEILVAADAPLHGRQLAGYQIKNNLQDSACSANPSLQTAVLQAVSDPQRNIRKVACSIISLAARESIWNVDTIVMSLGEILVQRSSELPAVHGAMRALSEVADDCIFLLDLHEMTGALTQSVLPYLTSDHLGNDADAIEVRQKALEIVAAALEAAGTDFKSFTYRSLGAHVLPIVEACFTNLQQPKSTVIAARCVACLVLSLTFHDRISDNLFGTMVQCMSMAMTSQGTTSADEQLRIEATTFWRAVLHFPRFSELAETFMSSLAPVLIQAMVYSDMEIGMLQAQAEDWNVPDKIDDIRPRHYQARVQNNGADDGEEEDDGDEVEEWNLRRVSARTLDELSEHYGEKILLPVLGAIDGMMQASKPWKELEAAILAIGAICDGCFDALTPYLGAICGRLLDLLEAEGTHFLVVNIALWTGTQVGRYLVSVPADLQRFVQCVLARMQNPSKIVQEAATSALATIAELCEDGQLSPYAPMVIPTISQCMRGYQLKNRVALFEALGTVAGVLSESLRSDPEVVGTLLGPIGELWVAIPDDNPLIFSYFECMSSLCTALGPCMQPMAKDIFGRAYGILTTHVEARRIATQSNQDPPEPEFLVTSADLLSGLFDALGSSLEPLVAEQAGTFMPVILQMTSDESSEIRSSGFALCGDVAKSCPTYVQAALDPLCDVLLRNLAEFNEDTYGVVSNAAWMLCNLLENQLEINNLPVLQTSPALVQLFCSMAQILSQGKLTADMRNMAENIVLCLGLMLYVEPDVEAMSNYSVTVFAKRFCEYGRNIKPVPQREQAMSGFIGALQRKDGATLQQLAQGPLQLIFDLACALVSDGPELQRAVKQLLMTLKNVAGEALWAQKISGYSEQMRTSLYQVYDVC